MHQLQNSIVQNFLKNKNSSSRLFHGRGGLLPEYSHIIVDYYSPHVLITLYKEETDEQLNKIVQLIKNLPDIVIDSILIQKRYLTRPELFALVGSIPLEAKALEDNLSYHLKFGDTQNIGFFLDMALGRKYLRENSKNKKVLNLFSYTCSLSVAALDGGATEVVNIDMSKAALNIGRGNHRLNEIDSQRVRFFPYDIMKSWNNIARLGPYDVVVIDPPTNQGESFKVERDYYKIVKRLNGMTNKEATVMACLNSPYQTSHFLTEMFKEHAPEFIFQETIYSAFREMEKNPEEGLKIVVFRKLS